MPQYLFSPDSPDPESLYVGVILISYEFPGDSVHEHDHAVGHWSFVTEGVVEYTVGGKTFDVAKNEATFIPARVKHSMRSKSEKATGMCIMPRDA